MEIPSAVQCNGDGGDTSLCVWSNRASAVIASSLLLQARRAAFPNPGPGTSAKDITRERGDASPSGMKKNMQLVVV